VQSLEDLKVLFLPKMPEDSFGGSRRDPRHSQQKSPLSTNNLARQRITANSRFLTKCYRQKAAKPPDTRHTDRSDAATGSSETRPLPGSN